RILIDALQNIMDATSHEGKRCINFVKRTDETSYIHFLNGTGCNAIVGYGKRESTIFLGKHCWKEGIVIHEILHTLGFHHEHARPDSGSYITLNTTNILDRHMPNFRRKKPSDVTTLQLPYDYHSIMHYRQVEFAIDSNFPTIIPKESSPHIGQRKGLSQLDIKKLQRLFGCAERKLINKTELYTEPPACNFEIDLCGWKQLKNISIKSKEWQRIPAIKATCVKGPKTDHTYGTFEGFYLFTKSNYKRCTNPKILTPPLASGNYTLSFWFQIKTQGPVPDLNVFKIDENYKALQLYSKPKKHMPVQGKWANIKLPVFSTGKTKFLFEVEFGNYSLPSSVALDDVTFQ
ncbi:high choriolytic enzyme 2-like, partial [Argonauta hians]